MKHFQLMRNGLLALTLWLPLCGFASPNPGLNFGDGSQRANANKIISNAFTRPMAQLAKEAASGDYKKALSYNIALELGRSQDDPQIDISKIAAVGETEASNQPIDIWIHASSEKKAMLDNWAGDVLNYLRACRSDCSASPTDLKAYPFATNELRYVTDQDYVTSHVVSCAAAISSYYKSYEMRSYLHKDLSAPDSKRKSLSRFLLSNFEFSPFDRQQGGHNEDCDPMKFDQYITLYGIFNPKLSASMRTYIDNQLAEKTENPNF